jgi:hypothetical protein
MRCVHTRHNPHILITRAAHLVDQDQETIDALLYCVYLYRCKQAGKLTPATDFGWQSFGSTKVHYVGMESHCDYKRKLVVFPINF